MKEIPELSETDRMIWKAGSALQTERPQGAPSPSYEEIGARAGVSRTTVANVIPHLKLHGIVKQFGKRRSVFFALLYQSANGKRPRKGKVNQ